VTKSEIKNLEKRVRGIDPQSSSTDDAAGARMDWLVSHLTEEERFEAATYIKRHETDQQDKEAEERMHGLLAKAEVRGNARPVSLREEFYQKHSRAEGLRSIGRVLTGAEHDELVALNVWFEKFRQEPRTFEEQLEAGAKELKENLARAKAEGIEWALRNAEDQDPVESYADERRGES